LDLIYEGDSDNLSIIRYHTWWPGSNDPYYNANIAENNARISYYGVNYTPDLWIDGDIHGGSGYGSWGNYITSEEGVSSPIAIDLSADYGSAGDYGTITAVITAIDPITESGLKTRFAITESHLPRYGQFEEFNNVMRDMVPDAGGLDLSISQGDTVTVLADYVLSNDWDFANLDIIAFVQADQGKKILQTARFTPPSGSVAGTVTSTESGFPIPNANVDILNTSYGDITDSQGAYFFSFIPGNQSVTVGAGGYVPDTLSVFITSGDTATFNIELQPGATSSITGTVTDPGTRAGLKAAVTLYMNGDSLATVDTDSLTGDYAFDGVSVSLPPWVVYTDLRVVPEIPYGAVAYGDTIQVEEGSPAVVDFALSPADVFLVDDDEGMTYETYFKDEIAAAGRTYYHYDVNAEGESAANQIELFPVTSTVVWFTGDASSSTISEVEQDSLASLLDRGGSVFLTGQNIAEDLDMAGSTLLSDYFHVAHGGNSSNWLSRGVQGNPVTGYLEHFVTTGQGGANNQTSRDILLPSDPAVTFIDYISSPIDTTPRGVAAVYVEGASSSKAILMGMGFESINRPGSDLSQATREETMLAILNWFDGIVDIGDNSGAGGGIQLPRTVALEQNYPNPFNPSTTIRYSVPSREDAHANASVQLALYDIRGRLINVLVDKGQAPGNYMVHWDGKDGREQPVVSGVYLYRLRVEDQVLTRKMTILR